MRAHVLQAGKVGVVHRQYIIEMQEILCFDLTPPQLAHVITALLRSPLRTRIRCLADVIVMRSSGIDVDSVLEPSLLDAVPKYRFRRG
ncbi:hypothetical protein UT5_02940 [Ferrigenium sp. UT5]